MLAASAAVTRSVPDLNWLYTCLVRAMVCRSDSSASWYSAVRALSRRGPYVTRMSCMSCMLWESLAIQGLPFGTRCSQTEVFVR